MLFGLFGGVLADRLDNRKAVMGTQSIQLIAAAFLAALSLTGVITLGEIYALAILGGLAQIVDTPSRQSLTYQLAAMLRPEPRQCSPSPPTMMVGR